MALTPSQVLFGHELSVSGDHVLSPTKFSHKDGAQTMWEDSSDDFLSA